MFIFVFKKKGGAPFSKHFLFKYLSQDMFRKILNYPICSSGEHTRVHSAFGFSEH